MSEIIEKVIVNKSDLTELANHARSIYNTDLKYNVPELKSVLLNTDLPPVLQEKNIIPNSTTQIITADEGYDALGIVNIIGDEDLIAANIKRGIEVFGITGTYNGPTSSSSTMSNAYLTINGEDYTVDGISQSSFMRRRFPLNTVIEAEYTGTGEFLHWVNADGKVQGGGERSCSVQLNTNTTLTPILLDDALPGSAEPYAAYIEFMSEYSQVMDAGTWSSADSAEQHSLPAGAMKISAEFLGWTLDGETICTVQDIIDSIDGSFAYKQIYGLYQTITIPVTITVGNNIDDSVFTVGTSRAKAVLVKKPTEGYDDYDVGYWSWDKEGLRPIDYLEECLVNPSHDTMIYIQYVPAGTAVSRISAVAITGTYPAETDESLYFITCFMRHIASDCNVVSSGILYTKDGNVQEETAEQEMVIGSSAVNVYTSTTTGRAGVLNLRTGVSSEHTVLWTRGFCTFTDANGEEHTIYSEVCNNTHAELMELEKEITQ